MKKKILQLSVLMALTGSAFAQSADNFVLPKHSIVTAADHFGQAVSKFDNYVLVGGPDDDLRLPSDCNGRSQMTGAVILYKDGQVKSTYRGNFTYAPDGITEVGWRFGQSVAMGADWLAIGAPNYNISKGRVFLVKRISTGEFDVAPNVTLDIPNVSGLNTSNANSFGTAVAMGRNTLAVGAPRAMFNGVECGAVFIYKLTNGVWSLVKTIVAPSSNVVADFGRSVAISDDEQKVIVGAPRDQYSLGYEVGAVHIFNSGTNNSWNVAKSLYGNYGQQGLAYGTSVDISNDRAVIGGSTSVIDAIKFDAVYGWMIDQHITVNGEKVSDVAIEGTKLIYGQDFTDGGRVVHLVRSGSGQTPWIVKSTVGLNQRTRLGTTVDLSNNVVVAGIFEYDYADITDPCPISAPHPDEHAGGAVLYNFDQFNGLFWDGHSNYRTGTTDPGTADDAAIISVSPNPAENGVVEITSNEMLLEVVAVSSTGASKQIKLTNSTADISELAPGLYILQIKTDKGISSKKVIVK